MSVVEMGCIWCRFTCCLGLENSFPVSVSSSGKGSIIFSISFLFSLLYIRWPFSSLYGYEINPDFSKLSIAHRTKSSELFGNPSIKYGIETGFCTLISIRKIAISKLFTKYYMQSVLFNYLFIIFFLIITQYKLVIMTSYLSETDKYDC